MPACSLAIQCRYFFKAETTYMENKGLVAEACLGSNIRLERSTCHECLNYVDNVKQGLELGLIVEQNPEPIPKTDHPWNPIFEKIEKSLGII